MASFDDYGVPGYGVSMQSDNCGDALPGFGDRDASQGCRTGEAPRGLLLLMLLGLRRYRFMSQ